MTDLSFLSDSLVLIILGICLCIGYVLKTAVPKLDNRYIPLIMAVLGVVLNIWLNKFTFTPEILLGGLFSGLASTGLHQVFHQLISKED